MQVDPVAQALIAQLDHVSSGADGAALGFEQLEDADETFGIFTLRLIESEIGLFQLHL